jgi:ribosomal protein S4
MVLKRIIRQYLNQHLPENIKPGQRLDRKAKKIIQNQNYFRYIPLFKRIKRAHSYLKYSQVSSVNENRNQVKYKSKQIRLKSKYNAFFKNIHQCGTLIKKTDKSSLHFKTELGKDYFVNNLTCNINKELISSNQWTGLDINYLTWRSSFYKFKTSKYYLYTLNQYKVGFARKHDRRDLSSIYKSQLIERKKLGLLYGNLSKKEIFRTIQRAEKYRGVLRENILRVLESRLDVILYRIGFFKTIPSARQWIIHRKILVNQQVVTIPHYQVKAGDVISVARVKSDILRRVIKKRFALMKNFKSSGSSQKMEWPFLPNYKVLNQMIQFGILNQLKKYLLQATKKIIENKIKQPGLSIKWQRWHRLQRYKKLLLRQRKRIKYPRWFRNRKKQQRFRTILLNDKKNRYKKQKLHHPYRSYRLRRDKKFVPFQRKRKNNNPFFATFKTRKQHSKLKQQKKCLLAWFETIRRLIKLKNIATLTRKEYHKKIRDPLFTYKFLILLKKTAPTFFSGYKKKNRTFCSIKKPLHLEISYQTLTAIYLYSPQKLFFPVILDIDGVKKSYY